jgi:asparagine synthase (glutamine-hydrolysing)
LFAGYRRYAELLTRTSGDGFLGRSVRRAAATMGAALFSPEAKFLARLRACGEEPLRRYAEREIMCSRWLTDRLLAPPYRATGADDDLFAETLAAAESRHWPVVEAAQYADLRTYLPGDILRKVDRTSMAWSLECRPPLLDRSVTELAASLSTDLKIRDGVGKYILKRVAGRYVPPELLDRKKRGFRVPIRRWLKRDLLDRTAELLQDGELVSRGILDAAGVRWVLRQQRRPWMNLASCLWALLFLEHWARIYLDGDS